MAHKSRYETGWDKLKEIDGEAGEEVLYSFNKQSFVIGKFIIEYSPVLRTGTP